MAIATNCRVCRYVRSWPDGDRVEPRGFSLVFAGDLSKAGRETQLTDASKTALQCPKQTSE